MKYILANIWLRNIFMLSFLELFMFMSIPFKFFGQEYLILSLFFIVMYLSCWLNNRLLIRYVLDNRRYWIYAIALVFMLAIMLTVDYQVNFIIPSIPERQPWNMAQGLLSNSLFLIVGFGINSAYREIMRRQQQLEQELVTKRNELRFLQNQVNPHFLFNSLNNLYSASIAEPGKVSEYILQMAELLRYQLSSSKREFVVLEEEINFLINYMDIEKRRLGRQVHLDLNIQGSFEQRQLAPLLFLPFLENAFKYSTGAATPANIEVKIDGATDHIRFYVANSVPDDIHILPVSTGIGIENARKRLELLYPHQHTLTIQSTASFFTVDLQIMTIHESI